MKVRILLVVLLFFGPASLVRGEDTSKRREVEKLWANAKIAYEKGDFASAVASFSEAIRLDPKNARSYGGRGMVYVLTGDYGKAIADESEAIRLNQKYAWGTSTAARPT